MKFILIIMAVLIVAVLIIALVGALLPRDHVATRRAIFRHPVGEIYEVVHDFAAASGWRDNVQRVELLAPRGGRACFREHTRHGEITYVVDEERAEERLVLRIADEHLPYGGTWTLEFQSAPGGSTDLRITERGFVKNVIFRFLARFVFGYTGSLESYLQALGKKFGEEVTLLP